MPRAGQRTGFELAVEPPADPFDRAVHALVEAIPYGQTRSYGELALELGDPGLAQRVGIANARKSEADQ